MAIRKVVGIDPDIDKSGWCEAQIDSDGIVTHTLQCLTEAEIKARFELFKSENISVLVAVENSWITALGKRIPLTYNTKKPMNDYERAKIAGNVAVNHATGQRIAKLVEEVIGKESLVYYYSNSGQRKKNPKYNQLTYELICKGEKIVPYKSTNPEKRDAFRACIGLITDMKRQYKKSSISKTPNLER
jgi:hypothetical protein